MATLIGTEPMAPPPAPPSPGQAQGGPDAAAGSVDGRSARHLSLVEQGLISGSNFLLLVAAARWLPKEQWGTLSFAMAMLLLFQGLFQRAFVLLPMSTTSSSRAMSVGNLDFWRWAQAIVALAVVLLLGAFHLVARHVLDSWLADSAWVALTIVVPSFYMEFLRRAVLLTQSMRRLLGMALCYACVVAGFAVWVAVGRHQPSLSSFAWCLAAAALASCLASAMLPLPRGGCRRPIGWTWPAYWHFGRWSVAASLGSAGYSFGIHAILAALAGPVAVGVYAAARNLVQPVSTLMQAMDNVDKARAGRAFAQQGVPGLWTVVRHSWSWLLALAAPYCVLVALSADWILPLVYGDKYADIANPVRWWCLVMATTVAVQPLETALYAARRPDLLFYGRLPGALLAMLLAAPMVLQWGVSGALLAVALGWLLAGAAAAWQLRQLAQQPLGA
jgi:O-antigen/teichoic acid export membrane protein